MNQHFHTYGQTQIHVSQPWGMMHTRGTRLLCSDGKIRAPHRLASTSDTFFSTPAAMRINGKYVTGYMTTESAYNPATRQERTAYVFRPHTESNEKQGNPLPPFPPSHNTELFDFLAPGETRQH
jgi:hypothetical protein